MKHYKQLLLILGLVVVLMLTGCQIEDGSKDAVNTVRAPLPSTNLVGCDWQDVVYIFEQAGFLSVQGESTEYTGADTTIKDGSVYEVSIGGSTYFSSNEWFLENASIVVRYYTIPPITNDQPSNNQPSDGSSDNIYDDGLESGRPSSSGNSGETETPERPENPQNPENVQDEPTQSPTVAPDISIGEDDLQFSDSDIEGLPSTVVPEQPEQNEYPSQNEQPESTTVVYRTKTGTKYHFINPCGNGTYTEISLREAQELGLEPCDKCSRNRE